MILETHCIEYDPIFITLSVSLSLFLSVALCVSANMPREIETLFLNGEIHGKILLLSLYFPALLVYFYNADVDPSHRNAVRDLFPN